MRQSGKKML